MEERKAVNEQVMKRTFDALAAIGAVKREPYPSPQASPAQEEPFSTYCFDFDTRRSDPYWCRLMAAWRQIADHKYLPGAMQWAEKHHPNLHRRITRELPGEWERLWDANASLDVFQAALDRWVAAHEELIGLFPVTRGTE